MTARTLFAVWQRTLVYQSPPSRGLDQFDLSRRNVDPMDRRSVLVMRTLQGTAFLRRLDGALDAASVTADTELADRRYKAEGTSNSE